MSDGWKFDRDPDGEWRWTYILHGRTVARARQGHKQYSACVAEARIHGYREHVAVVARRRGPGEARELSAKGKKR